MPTDANGKTPRLDMNLRQFTCALYMAPKIKQIGNETLAQGLELFISSRSNSPNHGVKDNLENGKNIFIRCRPSTVSRRIILRERRFRSDINEIRQENTPWRREITFYSDDWSK